MLEGRQIADAKDLLNDLNKTHAKSLQKLVELVPDTNEYAKRLYWSQRYAERIEYWQNMLACAEG